MKFEFIIAIIHSVVFLGLLYNTSLSFRSVLIILLITQYGPVYPLLKLNSFVPFTIFVCFLIIILTIRKSVFRINKYEIYFIIIPLICHIIGSIMYGFNLFSFSKGILVFSIILSSFFSARYFSNKDLWKILDTISISFAVLSIVTVVLRFAYAETLRDAGLPLIITGFFVYALIKKKKLEIIAFSIYLLSIETRSILILLIILMFFYRKDLIKSIGKVTSLVVYVPLFILIYNIIYNRTIDPSQSLDEGAISTLITRLNAVTYELDVFFNYPIFGAGLFYFDSFWKELLGDQLDGISGLTEYIAFNHIGYTSLLAQSGIVGFIVFIIIPIKFITKNKLQYGLDKFLKSMLILYLLSFLISGSPIRTDFPDMFFYMFIIFLLYFQNIKKKLC